MQRVQRARRVVRCQRNDVMKSALLIRAAVRRGAPRLIGAFAPIRPFAGPASSRRSRPGTHLHGLAGGRSRGLGRGHSEMPVEPLI